MQAHQPQGGDAKATTPALKVGDKVTYTVTRATGRSVRISVKEATIVALLGESAIIKRRNGHKECVPLSILTPADQPNALTRALLGNQVEGQAND
ncbi:hypothetical protein ELR50_11095 [Pseudomonas citronellolis]|uniref:hypothetical protein n=1 Tax=Pseudomonas citronellolis TaxID=53408 RepID=UPI0022BA1B18|nr:hypothetical protein [Pseudomonas citronellolis]WBG63384.1 hypothetical protein ELR50_11095 [Pseudomonas citronellolis]